MYTTISYPIMDKTATLSVNGRLKQQNPDYSIRQLPQKYDSYQALIYHNAGIATSRRRLSSTGEASGDSSTTASGGSSCGEREDGSEGRAESDETDRDADLDTQQQPVTGHITENERLQVETFFRGLKTQVYVCSSLANLYVGTTAANSEWELRYTGIPVVLLDTGETRSRDKRRIQILLAERGTCFTLWRDTIDNLSAYKVSGRAFHTMYLSSDHSQLIGFTFDTVQAAHDMWTHIERLISDPENISLSMPGRKKKKPTRPSKPAPLPPKSHISQPCCFQHVTSVDVTDRERYFSMQALVPLVTEIANSSQPVVDEGY